MCRIVKQRFRMILTFAVSLLIGNIFRRVYSMMDTMVAGYCLANQAIAAIGSVSSLYGLVIDLARGLNNGFALIITQAFGACEQGKIRKSIGHMMVLDGIIAAVLAASALISLPSLMRLMKTAPVISSIIKLLMKITAVLWIIPFFGFIGVCVTEPVTWAIMTAFLTSVYPVKTGKIPAV